MALITVIDSLGHLVVATVLGHYLPIPDKLMVIAMGMLMAVHHDAQVATLKGEESPLFIQAPSVARLALPDIPTKPTISVDEVLELFSSLKAQLAQLAAKNAETRSEDIHVFEKQVQKLKDETDAAIASFGEKQGNDLMKVQKLVDEAMDNTKRETEARVVKECKALSDNVEARLAVLNNGLMLKSGDVADLQQRLDISEVAVDSRLEKMDRAMNILTNRTEGISRRIDDLLDWLERTDGEVTELANRIEGTNGDVEKTNKGVEELKVALTDKDKGINALEKRLKIFTEEKNEEIQALEKRVKAAEETAASRLEYLETRYAALRGALVGPDGSEDIKQSDPEMEALLPTFIAV